MKLLMIDFKDVLGLNGTLNFLKGQPVILYGENLAGKTNVINILRYCLIPKRARKRTYSEEQRLSKNEFLIAPLKEGKLIVYFVQNEKLYQLAYSFRRTPSGAVNQIQRMYETEVNSIPDYEDEELRAFLSGLEWERLDVYSVDQIKEKIIEIGMYPEILDTLIAPSNVRNFSKTINKEIVTIPEVISQTISKIRNNVRKYLGNLETMNGILVVEKESSDGQLKSLQKELTKISPEESDKINKMFTKNVHKNLKTFLKEAEETIEKIPEETTKIENIMTELNKEIKEQTKLIQELNNELKNKQQVENIVNQNAVLEDSKTTVDKWITSFQNLPSAGNMAAFVDFKLPKNYKKFDFEILTQPAKVKAIFAHLEKIKKLVKLSDKIVKKHDTTFENLPSSIISWKRLRSAIKAPRSEPVGDQVIISYLEKEKKAKVSIPVDTLIKKPQYLKIHSTPVTHKPYEKIKELDTLVRTQLKLLTNLINELTKAKNSISEAQKVYSLLKRLLPILEEEKKKLEEKRKENLKVLTDIQSTWNQTYGSLCRAFAFEPQKIDLSTKASLESSLRILNEALENAKTSLWISLKEKLKEFPEIKIKKEITEQYIDRIVKTLTQKIKELLETKKRCEKIRDWINKHSEEIKDLEQKLKAIALLNILIVTLKEIFDPIYQKTDLETITERLSEGIEEEVREAYQRILADESLKFEHIGKGMFRNTLKDEPITHPSGSQRASISLGIMMALAKTFNLPVILDEATDRYDTNHIKTFMEYIVAIASDLQNPQICLAIYKTMDVEKNPELLSVIEGSRIYGIERKSPLNKVIKRIDLSSQIV